MLLPSLRPYRSTDRDALLRCQQQLNAMLGKDYAMPDPDASSTMLILVAELEGEVIGGLAIEVIGEMKFIGADPRVTAAFKPQAGIVYEATRRGGLNWLHCHMPSEAPEAVAKSLTEVGFEEVGRNFQIEVG